MSRSARCRFGTSWSTNDAQREVEGAVVERQAVRGGDRRAEPRARSRRARRRSASAFACDHHPGRDVDPVDRGRRASARASRSRAGRSPCRRRAGAHPDVGRRPARSGRRASRPPAPARAPTTSRTRRRTGRTALPGRSWRAWCHEHGRHMTVARIVRDPTAGVVQPDRPARSGGSHPMPTTSPADRLRLAPHPRRRPGPRPPGRAPLRRSRLRDQRRDRGRPASSAPAWLLRRPGRAPDPLDAWLPVSAGILALLVAVRGDPFLAVLDSLVALACCGAVARRVLRPGGHAPLGVGHRGDGRLGHRLRGRGPVPVRHREPARAGRRAAPAPRVGRRRSRAASWSPCRSPLIFAVLFASADPVFARAVGNVLGFRIDLGGLPGRILFVVAAGVAGGRRGLGLGPRHPGLRGRLARRGQPDGPDPGHPRARAARGARDPGRWSTS